ncbi:hypothetical protein BDV93DRAFT_514469 [Ceratobasidium sp. AG-I]|nr:hypothetical protein BDV93DRAFT_514469 [Ceratobasidium sp. AG-I]
MSGQLSSTNLISSNDDNTPPIRYAVVGSVTVHARKQTPYKTESSTRCSTPLESAFDSESLALSPSSTVKRRVKTQIKRQNKELEVELADSISRINVTTSTAYIGNADPVNVYKGDGSVKYHAFDCTNSHNKKCTGVTKKFQQLDMFGVTGGTKRLSPEQVREYVGLWMAECARPFQMINDRYV